MTTKAGTRREPKSEGFSCTSIGIEGYMDFWFCYACEESFAMESDIDPKFCPLCGTGAAEETKR